MSAPSPGMHVAVDPDLDTDSAYGDENASYTTSLKSSAFNYRYELGRRYHSFREGRHFLPNDEQEQDRMDLLHSQMMLLLDNNLYFAPINRPQRVLDIGTGTGIWAIDFADAHPESEVMGNDLSPIQPTYVAIQESTDTSCWPRLTCDQISSSKSGVYR